MEDEAIFDTLPPIVDRRNGQMLFCPPHSIEAEQGTLGCIILAPEECLKDCVASLPGGFATFYDLRHRTIYRTLLAMHKKGKGIDVLTLVHQLTEDDTLDKVGGYAYISSLPDATPSAANLHYYLPILNEHYSKRSLSEVCYNIQTRIQNGDDFEDLLWYAKSELTDVFKGAEPKSLSKRFSVQDLVDFDVTKDEDALIGKRPDGSPSRYICQGYGAWLIGPSGIGKSSLAMQMAIAWAIGVPVFNIAPLRPLRVLIVQDENDQGDVSEMVQGVLDSMGIDEYQTQDTFAKLNENLMVVSEHTTIGHAFCSWLGQQIEEHRAELVIVDPLLSFAGIDVSRQDQCSRFLRTQLNPVLKASGCAMLGVHHTGKPKEDKAKKNWTVKDHAYAGLGSSELVNWARATMTVIENGDCYNLMLTKREKRACATHPDGTPTVNIWLKHGDRGISWVQMDPPQEPEEDQEEGMREQRKTGRPSKVEAVVDYISKNLTSFAESFEAEHLPESEAKKIIISIAQKAKKIIKGETVTRTIETLMERGYLKTDELGNYFPSLTKKNQDL